MAVTLFVVDGFEGGVMAAQGWSNVSVDHSFSTTTVRSGLRSLRFNTAAANATARYVFTSTTRFLSVCFYIRWATLPDNDWTIIAVTPSVASLRYDLSDNKFNLNNVSFGPTLATGQWYRVVIEWDADSDPAVVRCVIDNDTANEATQNITPFTPANLTNVTIGQPATNRTQDVFFEDFVVSETDGDYEQMRDDWTAQAIESLIPTSDGTHNITTSGDFDSFTGTAFSNSTTNGNTFIGHRPLQHANTANQVIRQELGTTANYMEFGLENHTLSGTPVGGRALAAHVESASAGASLGEARLLLADNTEVLTVGSLSVINSTEDPSTTVTNRHRILIAPSGGWDNTKIDGLKARVGFADNAPDVNFIDFMLELVYVTKEVGGVALTITPSLPAGEVQEGAGGQTVTGVALSATPTLPVGVLNHGLTGVALAATPTLPAGALTHTITGVVLPVTPSLPVGAVTTPGGQTVDGVLLSVTPSLPAGSLTHSLTGVALAAAPSLPVGSLSHSITGAALTISTSLPPGLVSVAGAGAGETFVSWIQDDSS